MQENGTAETGPRRVVIVSKLDDDVIDMVVAPEPFMRGGEGQGHRTVVERMSGSIAPAIMWAQGNDRQSGLRRR